MICWESAQGWSAVLVHVVMAAVPVACKSMHDKSLVALCVCVCELAVHVCLRRRVPDQVTVCNWNAG